MRIKIIKKIIRKIIKKERFLCKIGLHWPLQRKRKAFTDKVSHLPVYICQCNCGKWWFASYRHSIFKIKVEKPYAWLVDLGEAEKFFT